MAGKIYLICKRMTDDLGTVLRVVGRFTSLHEAMTVRERLIDSLMKDYCWTIRQPFSSGPPSRESIGADIVILEYCNLHTNKEAP